MSPGAGEAGGGAASRLSVTNPADPQNSGEKSSARRPLKLPLTERESITLRTDVRDWGALDGRRPITWLNAVRRWRDYIRDKREVSTVLENEAGQRATTDRPHRFHPDYADKQYAKLKDLQRGLSDAYGRRLHTTMLTFTCSSTDEAGRPRPPVDHLEDLLESWSALTRSLRRSLDHLRSERLAILEPHKSGYFHIHMAVFTDGRVTREDFAPVIRAHLRNCPGAGEEAHDLSDDSTISIRHAGADRDLDDDEQLDELAIYLAEYLCAYGEDGEDGADPLELPEHVQAANAVLWATGRQRWRPSNGAQEYMSHDPPEADESGLEWSLAGIEKDGEFIACDGDNGGVDTFTTDWGPPTD